MKLIAPLLQIAAGDKVLVSTGIGFTATTTLLGAKLLQPFALTVNTYVTLIGAVVELVKVSFGFPVPAVGPAGVMPAMVARVHGNVGPPVELVGV